MGLFYDDQNKEAEKDKKCIMHNRQKHWFLVNDQRDAQFFIVYLFLYLTLYMFRTHRAHHQEK
jgi:hypothetical protein